jgi:cytochrome P450
MRPPAGPAPAVRTLGDLPAPKGLPWLGQALQIERERLHQQLEGWLQTLGDPFRLTLAGRQFMVTGDHATITAAMRDRPDTFGRSQRLVDVSAEFGFPGLFSVNGDTWRRHRKLVMAALDPTHVRDYMPQMALVASRLVGRWQAAARQQQVLDLQPELMRFTVDVIAGLAFGTDINTVQQDGVVIQQHLDQLLPALFERVLSPAPRLPWRTRRQREMAAHIEAVRQAVDGFLADARQRLAANPALRERPSNLIEAMIVARDDPASGLSDEDVAGNMMTMLLAGEDTTANTLAWMLDLMWRHPETLERARAEVDAVVGAGGWPTQIEQLARLDYLEACAHEAMRLKPVGPMMPQQVYRDTVLSGVALPAGSFVMLMLRQPGMAGDAFEDPQRFEPERWLARDTQDTPNAGQNTKRLTMPFGGGPRMCPGRYLALAEIKMVMATLLASFDIEAIDTPDGQAPAERLALTMSPVGLTMRLRERHRL